MAMKTKTAVYWYKPETGEELVKAYMWLAHEINLLHTRPPTDDERNPDASVDAKVAFQSKDGVVYVGEIDRFMEGFNDPLQPKLDLRIKLGENQDTSGLGMLLRRSQGWNLIDIMEDRK